MNLRALPLRAAAPCCARARALQEQRGQKVAIAEPLAVKISENEAIKNISDSLQAEEAKLVRFNEIEGQANKSKEKYDGLLKQLAISFIKYRDLHQVYADSINDNTSLAAEDLEFSVETPFRREAFIRVIQSSFDRRTSFKAVIDKHLAFLTFYVIITDNYVLKHIH